MGLLKDIKNWVYRDTLKNGVSPNVDGCNSECRCKHKPETTDEIIKDIEDELRNVIPNDDTGDECLGDFCDEEMSEEDRDIAENFLGTINFTVLKDGRLYINCGWVNASDETAEIYGKFLFLLNDGRMSKNILKYLVGFGSQDYKLGKFANKIIQSWHDIDQEENNKPVISPTRVFSMNNNNEEVVSEE